MSARTFVACEFVHISMPMCMCRQACRKRYVSSFLHTHLLKGVYMCVCMNTGVKALSELVHMLGFFHVWEMLAGMCGGVQVDLGA